MTDIVRLIVTQREEYEEGGLTPSSFGTDIVQDSSYSSYSTFLQIYLMIAFLQIYLTIAYLLCLCFPSDSSSPVLLLFVQYAF
jgi:hypothetical protein